MPKGSASRFTPRQAEKLTAEQIRERTPATERWIKTALDFIGEPALDSDNNYYAYMLREFELAFPTFAAVMIPLFAKKPTYPWWKKTRVYVQVQ